jgi:hypothetical protein
VQIIDRPALMLQGSTVKAGAPDLPEVVPALWREVFAAHAPGTVFAELSEEPGGDLHVITVGVLVADGTPGAVAVPAGRWLHHEHRGPLHEIGASYGQMFACAAEAGETLGTLKLDVGYRADGQEPSHDLYVQLAD